MKGIFVRDIRENSDVKALFLVKEKTLAVGKTGKPYLALTLMDRTGEMDGRVWDDAESFSTRFDADDFVRVEGRAVSYMGKLQLRISEIEKVDENDVVPRDFLPSAERDPEEMFTDLEKVVDSLKDGHIRTLMNAMLGDPRIAQDLKHAPAAKGMHHVYVGGLIEHVLSLCRLIDLVCGHYGGGINRDLLVAGAILHDIGKTRELSYTRSFSYTDEGRLIGHITIGVEMLDEKIRNIEDFPQELAMLLKHMILSHHGEYEYGSPKRPKTLEATILNYLDDLDAKVNSIRCHITRDSENGSNWTSYHRLFDRYIYKENFMPAAGDEGADRREDPAGEEELAAGKTMTLFES